MLPYKLHHRFLMVEGTNYLSFFLWYCHKIADVACIKNKRFSWLRVFGSCKVQAVWLWESLPRCTQTWQLEQDGRCVCITELIWYEDQRAERGQAKLWQATLVGPNHLLWELIYCSKTSITPLKLRTQSLPIKFHLWKVTPLSNFIYWNILGTTL